MESIGTDPRTLADDLLVTAAGSRHLELITQATNHTHKFLDAMGAKVATHKAFCLPTGSTHGQYARHTNGIIPTPTLTW